MPIDTDKFVDAILDKAKSGDVYAKFYSFMSKNLGAENLDFIAAVDSYKAGKETAQNIFNSYIRKKKLKKK